MSNLPTPVSNPQKLRFGDYYGNMSWADFQIFEAACEAGTADPLGSYNISAGAL